MSFFPFLLGIIIFIIPILIAFHLSQWQVVSSFVLSILLVPILFIAFEIVRKLYITHEEFKWNDAGAMAAMFILPSIPIYLGGLLPLYHFFKTLPYPLMITFPLAIMAISITIFLLLVTKSWGLKEFSVILFCSGLHAVIILSGIALLQKKFP